MNVKKNLLTADKIIESWELNRYQASKLLNLDNFPGSVIADKIIENLFPRGVIIENSPFEIKTGKYIGNNYIIITNHSICQGYTKVNINQLVHEVIANYQDMSLCENKFISFIQNAEFLKCNGSPTENYIMISCFIEKEMRKKGFLSKPTFRWAYKFPLLNKINIIEQIPTLTFNSIKWNLNKVKNVIYQLIIILHFLSKYAFTHGNPSLNYLNFWNESFSFEYETLNIESDILLSISPSSYSSISYMDKVMKRIYHPGNIADQTIDVDVLPEIEFKVFDNYQTNKCKACDSSEISGNSISLDESNTETVVSESRISSYKIKNNFLPYVRYLGIPLFYSSFDFYCFFVTMMSNSKFRNIVVNDIYLYNLWKELWLEDEYEIMMENLNSSDLENSEKILLFLKSFHLRCDALYLSWNYINMI